MCRLELPFLWNRSTRWRMRSPVVLTRMEAWRGTVRRAGCLTIAPTQSVPFAVTFTPSHLGLNTAALTVTDATTGYSNSIPLIGYGEPDAPSLTPSTLNFGPTE